MLKLKKLRLNAAKDVIARTSRARYLSKDKWRANCSIGVLIAKVASLTLSKPTSLIQVGYETFRKMTEGKKILQVRKKIRSAIVSKTDPTASIKNRGAPKKIQTSKNGHDAKKGSVTQTIWTDTYLSPTQALQKPLGVFFTYTIPPFATESRLRSQMFHLCAIIHYHIIS